MSYSRTLSLLVFVKSIQLPACDACRSYPSAWTPAAQLPTQTLAQPGWLCKSSLLLHMRESTSPRCAKLDMPLRFTKGL
jgi:hypothetical protein